MVSPSQPIATPAFVLTVLLSVPAAFAQQTPDKPLTIEQLRARWEQGEPVWKLEWRIDENGDLAWRSTDPVPDDRRSWQTVDLLDALANVGLVGWVNAMAAGPRDLASLTDAERYFSSLGLSTGVGELRKLVVTPVIETDKILARRASLERILAVRLIQERRITEANAELRAVMSNVQADPFLRQAARDVLGTGESPAPVSVPDAALATLPEDADFLFFFDQTRIPPLFPLPRLGVQVATQVTYGSILRLPGPLEPDGMLARAQVLLELASLVPLEFALRYGNARVDWVLGAFRARPRNALSLRAHGRFETEALRTSLALMGVESEGETLRGDSLGPLDLTVELDEEQLHVATWNFERQSDQRASELRAAGVGDAPIWVHVPGKSSIWEGLPLPVATRGVTLEIEIAEQVTVTVRTEHETAELARGMATLLNSAREEGQRVLQAMETSPDLVKALGILRTVNPRVEENTCVLHVEMREITLDDVSALLRRFELR